VSESSSSEEASPPRSGIAAGLTTYVFWGLLLPLYLKLLADMPPPEVLAHRIVWSVPTMILVLAVMRGGAAVREIFRHPRIVLILAVTAVLITINWLIYIFAITDGRMLQASMGYYINPLVNVLFGRLFLKETMTPRQFVAVGCAVVGVSILIAGTGQFPIVALSLAFSFGTYGLLRKTIPVDGASGLFVETLVIGPVALGYLLWLNIQGVGHFGHATTAHDLLLIFAGPATAIPLVLFGYAVRRVRLSTMGLMQYITPTGQFLLATMLFGEPFGSSQLWAFACIWTGLAIYSIPRDVFAAVGLRIR